MKTVRLLDYSEIRIPEENIEQGPGSLKYINLGLGCFVLGTVIEEN